MIKVRDAELQRIIDRLHELDQGHIFRFWDELTPSEQEDFIRELRRIDLPLLEEMIRLTRGEQKPVVEHFTLEPTQVLTLKQRVHRDEAVKPVGEEALRKGQVAAFLVAGGQGTRLGFNGPKGIFPITPVKQKSLFQLHAEKILALSRKVDTAIPWYIMTSESNYQQTVDFFEKNRFFGLPKEQVTFFKQQMLPALDTAGHLILYRKNGLFWSPNGHGGSVKALWDSGALRDMKQKGVKYIFYFQVDNVLVRICDPLFIGYHIASRADMSNKVIRKRNAEERVGVVCKINGQDGVVEYSDLKEEDMYARTPDGELKYWAGSIAIHMLNVEFVEQANRSGFSLPYHLARKTVPYVNEQGQTVTPTTKNGIKFETFVFDLMLQANKVFNLEVDRSLEFSPVKNKAGEDSPTTARNDLLKYYARMLQKAGISVPLNATGLPKINLEISPLFALDEEELLQKKELLPPLKDPYYLE